MKCGAVARAAVLALSTCACAAGVAQAFGAEGRVGVADAAGTPPGLPTFEEVRASHRPSDIPLLDRRGATIQWLRVDSGVRRGPWVALADTSPALREAIVLSEDRRFWAHGGVDWRALAASAWANAWNTRTRGASTVTMQLAGLLDAGLARPPGGRDLPTKVAQIVRAQQLEARWTKAQILEAYLNAVPLRGELVGIGAASQQLFGKHPSGLDRLEAAVLAVLVRAPNAPPEAVARRACDVLRQAPAGVTSGATARATTAVTRADACTGVATVTSQALARRPGPMLGESLAPHLARLMWREAAAAPSAGVSAAGPRVLASTLDAPLQRVARDALRRQLAELRGRAVDDGAVLVLDNASGEVLAWVGAAGPGLHGEAAGARSPHATAAGVGRAAGGAASEMDAVLARRQPGSTIKPFVYALALERRLVTAASRIDDSPLQLAAGAAGLYAPRNYDHAYRGGITVREALGGSVNVPAVRVAAMLGPQALFDRLDASGLRLTHDAGHHGLALALGSADVNLLDLTNAYRMLARGGQWTPVQWQRRETPAAASAPGRQAMPGARRVFSPEAAWLVSHILADPAARAAGFGLDSPLVTRGHAAVKTGTSKDMRDNWCIGSTDRYTVGVWVGNAAGRPMHAVSGVSGAAPVWREVVMALGPSKAPPPPAGLVASGGEWFIAGTEPVGAGAPADGAVAEAGRAGAFGIESPRDGTVIALDPEIPLAAQRVVLRGAHGQWWLDGRPLGTGTRLEWLPRPGRHVLERRDGSASDRIAFEVRSFPTRAAAARRGGGIAAPPGATPPATPPAATPRPG